MVHVGRKPLEGLTMETCPAGRFSVDDSRYTVILSLIRLTGSLTDHTETTQ